MHPLRGWLSAEREGLPEWGGALCSGPSQRGKASTLRAHRGLGCHNPGQRLERAPRWPGLRHRPLRGQRWRRGRDCARRAFPEGEASIADPLRGSRMNAEGRFPKRAWARPSAFMHPLRGWRSAEREGFEPPVPLRALLFSRQTRSTTLAPLREFIAAISAQPRNEGGKYSRGADRGQSAKRPRGDQYALR